MSGIAVVGSANVDLVGRAPRLPRPGETVLGDTFIMAAGGKGANQAAACAKLGTLTRFVGRVGCDTFGDYLIGGLKAAGVDVTYIVRDEGAPSGVAMILVDGEGGNSILVAPGANGRLAVEDVDAARAALHADALLLQLEVPLAAVERAAMRARELGAIVVLNPAPARHLPTTILRLVDVLTPNQGELGLLTGMDVRGLSAAERAARAMIEKGAPALVVTLAEAGALVVTREEACHVPGYRVEVVDTTGAGDAFNAGLAVALVEGQPLVEATRFANATGALATTALGAREALPTREQVLRFLASAGETR